MEIDENTPNPLHVCHFNSLDLHLKVRIFSFLDFPITPRVREEETEENHNQTTSTSSFWQSMPSIYVCSFVCKEWNHLCKSSYIWKFKFRRLKVSKKPRELVDFVSLVYNNKLYVHGGHEQSEAAVIKNISDGLHCFDFATSTWTEIQYSSVTEENNAQSNRLTVNNNSSYQPTHKLKLTGHTGVLYDKKIYFFGGCRPEHENSLHSLDLETFLLTKIKPNNKPSEIPSPRYGHSAVVYGDAMYVYGGWNGDVSNDEFFCFSFKNNKWYRLGVAKEQPCLSQIISQLDELQQRLVAQHHDSSPEQLLQQLQHLNNNLQRLVHQKNCSTDVQMTESNDDNAPADNESFLPWKICNKRRKQDELIYCSRGKKISNPPPLRAHKAFVHQQSMYLVGGYSLDPPRVSHPNNIFRYDFESGAWWELITDLTGTPGIISDGCKNACKTDGPGPCCRSRSGVTLVKNRVYIFGGTDRETKTGYEWLYEFDLERWRWRQIKTNFLTTGIHQGRMIYYDRKLWIFGGFFQFSSNTSSNDIFVCDIHYGEAKPDDTEGVSSLSLSSSSSFSSLSSSSFSLSPFSSNTSLLTATKALNNTPTNHNHQYFHEHSPRLAVITTWNYHLHLQHQYLLMYQDSTLFPPLLCLTGNHLPHLLHFMDLFLHHFLFHALLHLHIHLLFLLHFLPFNHRLQ
eukprot:TRINITY_DN2456_c0_g1_i1.p1 TRINITY_DN2456_c0_g1~~TRINITY_DN2456_c0_g1_i1.p1  ORF type:complete len:682 (+),score=145.39 TRINITY_DN2456_c0_g1_i1:143-2188(+)